MSVCVSVLYGILSVMADMKLIKQLRKMTHAPLKDCKSAIEEANGDLDRAQEILREKGALKAAKKSDRETNEGVSIIKHIWERTVGVKIACETDFVAKNPTFLGLVDQAIQIIAKGDVAHTVTDLSQESLDGVDTLFKENFSTIGENMRLVDAFVETGNSYVYIHSWNRIASAVFYEGDEATAKGVALQVVAANPEYLVETDISQEENDALRAKFKEELKDSGKPEAIHDQIIEWKMKKSWSESVLLRQSSLMDDSKTVGQALLATDTTVQKYIRFAI